MQERLVTSARSESLVSTHKVLRNTYFLLALTLAFSSVVAVAAMVLNLPRLPWWGMLVGFYGLLFLTHATANSAAGIASVFALTGFLGYSLGPILNAYLSNGLGDVVALAFGATALVFFACSAYVLTTKKDMSFLSGMMIALFVVLLVGVVANIFLEIPALNLAISALFIVFSSGAILLATSNIIHGGETNYIRATVDLYVSLYNLFVSFLNIFGVLGNDD
ncbi:Bax inhibitor-1 family protein [Ursidibacter maritimus]|uniref:Bax inhibitor-1 family protein n=1 Tax=Ursidibacter maritimus TaxID=1331689 RepID=A0A949T7Z2_9PAST|nr:Bax inhibitor-1 family protein [Ursidibacter maritimus]KAE9539051.1 BAX inhibitor protein [Ursidibacter maritimus]MBV6524685.1 Bax inhibitor-1 family protein [Ursidibacter maritimus]MBV6526713.1 Bax inhibitor-1 family protein [Ursidibacter maritimus]MBV6527984.1 Bax inhibitor-1 family protein [Ursidibacter maritimus]MBV6530160.1 Bax inhibitor-1 family protein [Ursidibacter maritimus]